MGEKRTCYKYQIGLKSTDLLRDGRFYRALLCAHWATKQGYFKCKSKTIFAFVTTIYLFV